MQSFTYTVAVSVQSVTVDIHVVAVHDETVEVQAVTLAVEMTVLYIGMNASLRTFRLSSSVKNVCFFNMACMVTISSRILMNSHSGPPNM